MKRDITIYLQHIIDACDRIATYIFDCNEERFRNDSLIQDGVIRQLEIIGEATKNIPVDFRNKHIHIPWQDVAGMRDKLIHHYFGVDLDIIWEIIKKELPTLKKQMLEIKKECHVFGPKSL